MLDLKSPHVFWGVDVAAIAELWRCSCIPLGFDGESNNI
jgi:hypothetical protein